MYFLIITTAAASNTVMLTLYFLASCCRTELEESEEDIFFNQIDDLMAGSKTDMEKAYHMLLDKRKSVRNSNEHFIYLLIDFRFCWFFFNVYCSFKLFLKKKNKALPPRICIYVESGVQ